MYVSTRSTTTLNGRSKKHDQQDYDSDNYAPMVGDTYYITEEAKPKQAKMITNIDDILQVVREAPKHEDPKEKQVLTLTSREGNLTGFLYQFVASRIRS